MLVIYETFTLSWKKRGILFSHLKNLILSLWTQHGVLCHRLSWINTCTPFTRDLQLFSFLIPTFYFTGCHQLCFSLSHFREVWCVLTAQVSWVFCSGWRSDGYHSGHGLTALWRLFIFVKLRIYTLWFDLRKVAFGLNGILQHNFIGSVSKVNFQEVNQQRKIDSLFFFFSVSNFKTRSPLTER